MSMKTDSECIVLYGEGDCDADGNVGLTVGWGEFKPIVIDNLLEKFPDFAGQNHCFSPCD